MMDEFHARQAPVASSDIRPGPAIGTRQAPPRHEYAEEAARAAQRFLDQENEIRDLKDDRDQWRNRALLGEGEIRRLEKREADLIRQLDERTTQVNVERDTYKQSMTKATALYDAASKILLDGYNAMRALEGKINGGVPEPITTTKPEPPRDPDLPSVVLAGPKDFDREDHDARS
jgi:hypothetical protein